MAEKFNSEISKDLKLALEAFNDLKLKANNYMTLLKNYKYDDKTKKFFDEESSNLKLLFDQVMQKIIDMKNSEDKTLDKVRELKGNLKELDNNIEKINPIKIGEQMAKNLFLEEVKKKVDDIVKEKIDDTQDEWVHILHLSDLHFGIYLKNITPADSELEFSKVTEKRLFPFLSDTNNDIKIDLIAVTGDISYQNNEKGYVLFKDWISRLCTTLNLDVTKDVIMCCGNHDNELVVNEENLIKHYYGHNDNVNAVNDVDRVLSIENVNERIKRQFDKYIFTCENLNIAKLESLHNAGAPYCMGKRNYKDLIFVILNSAWNALYDVNNNWSPHGNLFLGRKLIFPLSQDVNTDRDNDSLTVTLFHHPLSWLHESEKRTYNNDQVKTSVKTVRDFSDVILNGHVHGKIEPPDILANKTLVFYGGALYTDDSPAFQFEIISINKTRKYCKQKVFTFNHNEDRWERDGSVISSRHYFSNARKARELLSMVDLGEKTKEEIVNQVEYNLTQEVLDVFDKMFKESKQSRINKIIEEMNFANADTVSNTLSGKANTYKKG